MSHLPTTEGPEGPAFSRHHSLVPHRAGSVPAVHGDCPDTQALAVSVGEATEDCHESFPAGGEGPSAAAPVHGAQTLGPCRPPLLKLGQTIGCGSPEVLGDTAEWSPRPARRFEGGPSPAAKGHLRSHRDSAPASSFLPPPPGTHGCECGQLGRPHITAVMKNFKRARKAREQCNTCSPAVTDMGSRAFRFHLDQRPSAPGPK